MTQKNKKILTESETQKLFEGMDVSPEAQENFAMLFETTLLSKLEDEKNYLKEEFEIKLLSESEKLDNMYEEQINKYLDFVVESWYKENEIAIEHGIKQELMESFVSGMKQLFTESYIDMPDGEADILKEANKRLEKAEKALEESIETIASLKEEKSNIERDIVLRENTEDLTFTEKETLKELLEGVDFQNPQSFGKKINMLKEIHFSKDPKNSKLLKESILTEDIDLSELSPVERVLARKRAQA